MEDSGVAALPGDMSQLFCTLHEAKKKKTVSCPVFIKSVWFRGTIGEGI